MFDSRQHILLTEMRRSCSPYNVNEKIKTADSHVAKSGWQHYILVFRVVVIHSIFTENLLLLDRELYIFLEYMGANHSIYSCQIFLMMDLVSTLGRFIMAKQFLASFNFHHLPSLCSWPTAAARNFPPDAK